MSGSIGVFNIYIPENYQNPCSPESRRSNGGLYREGRAGRQNTFVDHLSGLLHLKCSQATTDQVRSQSSTERNGVNASDKVGSQLPVLTLYPSGVPLNTSSC